MKKSVKHIALGLGLVAAISVGGSAVAAPAGSLLSQVVAAVTNLFADPSLAEKADAIALAPLPKLGRALFNDTDLSEPKGQSCASCHAVDFGFTDPNQNEPTSRGAVKSLSGPRNTPPAGYADFSPPLSFDPVSGLWTGGQFWDGRASTLEEQAAGPFLGGVEMHNPSKQAVVDKVAKSAYAKNFQKQFGSATVNAFADVNLAYQNITMAIAAYERSAAFKRFNSKYDAYLLGTAKLSAAEARGLALYENPAKGNCAACHVSAPQRDPVTNEITQLPLFTDYSYDNLGVPKNPANRWYSMPASINPDGANFVDLGLGATVNEQTQLGKFKVPSLRNIARTAPYMHNGYFTSLRSVVDFYNTAGTKPLCAGGDKVSEAAALKGKCWPAPEYAATINRTELGNLGLTAQDVDDIVTFMGTLTDGYTGTR
ncbi:MAG: cytochrome-c peroxidase [Leptothrix sp. (in: b-proteobacteria)]